MSTAEKSDTVTKDTTRDGLEQVRDILIGGQLRELERKIARLEGRLGGDVDEIRKEIGRRLSDLESYVRGEIEAISSRIDDERNARLEALAHQAKEAREAVSNLELRTNRVDDAGSRGLRDLRRQMLETSKSLLDEVSRTRDELLSLFEPREEVTISGGTEQRPSVH